MRAVSRFTHLAGSAAVAALSVSTPAHADSLYQDSAAINKYRPALSIQVAKAAGDDLARGTAGGFMLDLEAALGQLADKPKIVAYPDPTKFSRENVMVAGVVPPKALDSSPIPVCAEQNKRVLGTWKIMVNGDVVADAWNGATISEVLSDGKTRPACNAYISARRAEFNQQLAQLEKDREQRVTVAATDGRTAANVAPAQRPLPVAGLVQK